MLPHNARGDTLFNYLGNRCAIDGNGQDLMLAMELYQLQAVAMQWQRQPEAPVGLAWPLDPGRLHLGPRHIGLLGTT